METLLSLAFDNLSSFDGPKVRKGLRQVEGLLAQICLSGSGSRGADTSPQATGGGEEGPPTPPTAALALKQGPRAG